MDTIQLAKDQPRRWKVLHDPITIDAACEMVLDRAREDGARTDTVFDLTSAAFTTPEGVLNVNGMPVRRRAFTQLCQKVHAPGYYLETIPTELALRCLNHGASEHGGTAMARRAGDEVRALVSESFGKLDDRPVFEMFGEALNGQKDEMEVFATASGCLTNLRIMLKETVKGPDGHGLKIGFDLRNSELGSGSLALSAVIYRMICTNGMVVQDAFESKRWRHVGDPARLRDAFRDGIPAVIEAARGTIDGLHTAHENVVSLRDSRRMLGRLDLTQTQRVTATREALGEAAVISISAARGDRGPECSVQERELMKGLDADVTKLTAWHLINGVTSMARFQTSHEQRLQAEGQAIRIAA